jgi:hypothetical protein
MDRAPLFRTLSRRLALLSLGALLFTTGCVYDNHMCMGMTEKWVHSDVNTVPKIIGTPFLAIFDSLIAPATGVVDLARDDTKYLSYCGSREVGYGTMGDGYKWITSLFSIPIETVWLIITGPVDLVTVLVSDPEHPAADEDKTAGDDEKTR